MCLSYVLKKVLAIAAEPINSLKDCQAISRTEAVLPAHIVLDQDGVARPFGLLLREELHGDLIKETDKL